MLEVSDQTVAPVRGDDEREVAGPRIEAIALHAHGIQPELGADQQNRRCGGRLTDHEHSRRGQHGLQEHLDHASRQARILNDDRPVLVEHCYRCHSAEAKKTRGGLALDTREGVFRGGDSGPAIVPGQAAKSLIIERMKAGEMPPTEKKVPPDQIAVIERWIAAGAPVGRTDRGVVHVTVRRLVRREGLADRVELRVGRGEQGRVALLQGRGKDVQSLADDPYTKGWLVKVKVSDTAPIAGLLDHDAYQAKVADEAH